MTSVPRPASPCVAAYVKVACPPASVVQPLAGVRAAEDLEGHETPGTPLAVPALTVAVTVCV